MWSSGLFNISGLLGRVTVEGGARGGQGRLELADGTESVAVDAEGLEVPSLGLPSRLDRRCCGSCAAKYIRNSAKGRKQVLAAQGAHG